MISLFVILAKNVLGVVESVDYGESEVASWNRSSNNKKGGNEYVTSRRSHRFLILLAGCLAPAARAAAAQLR